MNKRGLIGQLIAGFIIILLMVLLYPVINDELKNSNQYTNVTLGMIFAFAIAIIVLIFLARFFSKIGLIGGSEEEEEEDDEEEETDEEEEEEEEEENESFITNSKYLILDDALEKKLEEVKKVEEKPIKEKQVKPIITKGKSMFEKKSKWDY